VGGAASALPSGAEAVETASTDRKRICVSGRAVMNFVKGGEGAKRRRFEGRFTMQIQTQ
jgi:hypothetical protein